MADTQRLSLSSPKVQPWQRWLPQVLTGVYLLIAIIGMAVLPFVASIGEQSTPTIPLFRMGDLNRPVMFIFPYFIGLIYLFCAAWVFLVRRQQSMGQTLVVLLVSIGLATGGLYDLLTARSIGWLWSLGLVLAGGSFFSLGVLYSADDPLQTRPHPARYYGYGISILLWLLSLPVLYNMLTPRVYSRVFWPVVLIYFILGIIFAGYRTIRWFPYSAPGERDWVRLAAGSSIISFGSVLFWSLISAIFPQIHFTPFLLILLIVFPAVIWMTTRGGSTHELNFMVSRTALYSGVAVAITVGYALLVTGLALASTFVPILNNPVFTGVVFFGLALGFIPLRQQMQNRLDRAFFRGEKAYQERLQTFTSDLASTPDLSGIFRVLRENIQLSLKPGQIDVFIFDPVSGQYATLSGKGEPVGSDLRFPGDSPLVAALRDSHTTLYFSRLDRLPPLLTGDEARMRLLAANVFTPLHGPQQMLGWLALGQRETGEKYNSLDFNFLNSICDQAAVAIDRAQATAKMENRAREMNVLARLAQGINVTLSFDDILELIYAQSSQIIPMHDFQLLLMEKEGDLLYPAFYLEDDDRVPEKENKRFPASQMLEGEIIHQRKALLTDEYKHECQKRGVHLERSDIFAWMGVPLNTGSETIGVLTASSRDPEFRYTLEQLSLFQAVADQAAGAIVKVRLLQEAERRARQLSSLNEVTRQLTSTLELEPLLQSMLNSAVEILNCDAGSLVLVDEQSGDLVFRAAVGPVAKDIVGRRMAPGSGLVGKAIKTREPVVVSNVQAVSEWSPKTDQRTGFATHSVLVVPMQMKEKVIGVIEVLNRKDGMPFTKDDESLLTAFASQAGIAIENARLYTMTDKALTSRVEELSIMQIIDRELNTSLETSRPMTITLEWAMRQSEANAGLVGLVHEEGLEVMASQGYTDELEPYAGKLLPLDLIDVQTVIAEGVPQRLDLSENGEGGLLKGARSQAMVAIEREEKVIGILLLESAMPGFVSEDTMEFLMRLSDHASIAISNAQLYSQVQAANLAKSEFVSFVAHELKNPMTSVKGFTDLLSSGVVGQVNEAQGNFLKTIRANVDRINTLISDLNDNSKIEVGRLRLDFRSLALADLVEETVRSTKRQVEEKEQTLIVQPLHGLPNVWADHTRLVQILVNLVSNANKYTEKGGQIILDGEACDNQWDPKGASNVVHLWVQDNGIGISEADQKKIFQKFFRAEDPKTREAPGTGLGLNITRSLVEMQGGRIWFESEFRKGTTFHITVPIAE